MRVRGQQHTSLPTCQPCDNTRKSKSVRVKTSPENWKLTQQQQAFIDSFAEDDKRKQ